MRDLHTAGVITRPLATAVAAFALALASLSAVSPASEAANPAASARVMMDLDCGDFSNQAEAQRYFISRGGPDSDPDGLDADGDGVACESNPCPCSTDTGGGGGGGDDGPSDNRPPRVVQRGNVIEVIDGDTVDVRLDDGRRVRVRVIGIDTPEVYGGTDCWGPEASEAAKKLLPRDSRVVLTSDRSQDLKDRYGRLLRYVVKATGVDLGRFQLTRGNARVYVYGGNPFEKVRKYRGEESKAKRSDAGLWGHCR